MKKEHELKKKALEKELYDHYVKIMEGMLKWCIHNQPEDIETFTSIFRIDKQEAALKAMEDTLKKWRPNNDTKREAKKSDS